MELNTCAECGEEFTSVSQHEQRPDDRYYVVEQEACDIIDGQYTEWTVIVCPKCGYVEEIGR